MRNIGRAFFGVTALVTGLGLAGTALAHPVLEFDQDVEPDVIFGSGNTNGKFTTDRRNGIEIGIRATIPFVGLIVSNGDGTYSYTLSETDLEPGGATAEPQRWNFDWTVNTDFDDITGLLLDQLTYELGMDGDPGLGTNFLIFDPITPSVIGTPDHEFGDNNTPNGGGVIAGDAAAYLTLLATKNVLQQSWQYSFFPVLALSTYDPTVPGLYTVYLLARNHGHVLARSEIQVLIGLPNGLPGGTGDCKKGGWTDFSPLFTNQGDCVSFVNTGK